MQKSEQIIIRKAKKSDQQELANLAYRAYYDRYFNKATTDRFASSLRGFKNLIPDEKNNTGQSKQTFNDYWEKAIKDLDNEKNQFICFVAVTKTSNGEKIIGFRKGYAAPMDDDEYKRYERENKKRKLISKRNDYFGITTYNDTRIIPLANKEEIAGSSSLYIDPTQKRSGLGKKLISAYAKELLKLGYKGMMTSCYIKNDSQKFLRAMGGDFSIKCEIPNIYLDNNGNKKIQNIPGLMFYWDKKALIKLANIDNQRVIEQARLLKRAR